jgi:hypothetical protein
MVKVKDKHSREAWIALSAEWSRSGLQQKQFCNQRGIDYRAFVNWRNRNKATIAEAEKATKRTNQAGFVTATLIDLDLLSPSGKSLSSKDHKQFTPISISTRAGHTIHIGDNFNEQTLLRLLKVMEATL